MTCSSALLSCSRAEKLTDFLHLSICGKHTGEHYLVMKEFNIRVKITEKKCSPGKTRMTCRGWDTSIHIGATITNQEGRDGLDIHCCCALPIYTREVP